MEQTLPGTCRVRFEDPHQLHDFYLSITPDEGFWAGGRFRFHIFVTEDYNMAVSTN
jgi:ubiquitin-conjugating enzyme E2 F